MVAAGHPLTAEAGARVLREGGNAVDAAVGAMLTSFVAEPLLTGLGAGGYMMVAGAGVGAGAAGLLRGGPRAGRRRLGGGAHGDRRLLRGCRAGLPHRAGLLRDLRDAGGGLRGGGALGHACRSRSSRRPRRPWRARASALNASQAYVAEILTDLLPHTRECAALWAPDGRVLREGELLRNPELGDALSGSAREGAEPFYTGDIAAAVCGWLRRTRRLAARDGRSRAIGRSSDEPVGSLPRPGDAHQPAAISRGYAAGIRAGAARPRPHAADAALRSSMRWPPPSPSARPSSSRVSTTTVFSMAFPAHGWARRRTSRSSIGSGARAAPHARTARARGSSSREPACTSTT